MAAYAAGAILREGFLSPENSERVRKKLWEKDAVFGHTRDQAMRNKQQRRRPDTGPAKRRARGEPAAPPGTHRHKKERAVHAGSRRGRKDRS